MDRNYVVGFEDFSMDAIKHFPRMDFSPIRLRIAAESSLLQMSSKDINVEDDASNQLAKDDPKSRDTISSGL